MIIAVICLGVCQIIAVAGACLLLRMWAERKQAEIEARIDAALRSWIEQPSPEQPSRLAELVGQVGQVVGSAAARSLMASVKQESSAIAHVANGIGDQVQAQVNPLAALVGGGRRGKNAALLRLAELLGPMLLGRAGGQGPSNGSQPNGGGSVSERIREKAR